MTRPLCDGEDGHPCNRPAIRHVVTEDGDDWLECYRHRTVAWHFHSPAQACLNGIIRVSEDCCIGRGT